MAHHWHSRIPSAHVANQYQLAIEEFSRSGVDSCTCANIGCSPWESRPDVHESLHAHSRGEDLTPDAFNASDDHRRRDFSFSGMPNRELDARRTIDPRNSTRMMVHASLSFDSMRPTGVTQSSARATTRLRGVEKGAYALESIDAYWSFTNADGASRRSSKDSQQYQAAEQTGADIVKRGRRP